MVSSAPVRGFSLVELLVVAGLTAVVLGMAIPGILAGAGRHETLAAARHLASRAGALRLQAVLGGRTVGIRFEAVGGDLELTALADGNGNGLRTTDVAGGIDTVVEGPFRLRSLFPGVRAELVGADGTSADGVRFGQSGILAFTPRGTASSGTLYLVGPGGWQFAVRVLGATGRIRVLERSHGSTLWRDVQ